ncbi:replication protein A 32 kDa subunit-like [Bolinopsis microptera]|uniref:replication protein A 32 kDa subunit-like n=1 Tax=Bolinopsis microptera TaxID=2820187 RepID=UPI003078BAAF
MFQGAGGFGGGFGGNSANTGGGGFGGGNTGGGFNAGGDQSFTSPGGSRKPESSNKPTSLMPVTVAMMLQADHNPADDIFNYKGVDVHLVTFVGMVRDIIEASTSITYKIDDYTGPPISVRKFIQEGEEDTSNMTRTHTYVRVYGHLRSLNDQRNVIAFKVAPLESHNEISNHILEVVRSHLKLKKGLSAPGGMAGAANGTFTNGNSHSNGNDSTSGLGPAQQSVFDALKKSSSDIGMSVMEMSKITSHLSVTQIRSAIDFLSNEGHIYSTVDDEHYKLTDYC